jgi:peptidoglycan/LPS O-acetylase OafA/YrhL
LLSLQYLRGLAAMLVVVHHTLGQVMPLGPGVAFLQGGVDVFFVISGLVMWLTTSRAPMGAGLFVRKRLARIVPLYWILTSLVVAVLLAAPRLLQTARFDPAHVAASYLFVVWPNPAPGIGLRPLIIPGWTLNYEMFFYAIFAVGLTVPRRARNAALFVALGLLAGIGLAVPGLPSAAQFYTSPIVLEFALGLLIAMTLGRWRLGSAALPCALFVAAAAALVCSRWGGLDDTSRLVRMGLPAAALVLAAVLIERAGALPRIGPAKLVGDASYAIYLSHPLLLSALAQAWRRSPLGGAPPAGFALLAVPAAVLVGVALHLWIERPITAWIQRRLRTVRPPYPASPALAEVSP